VDSILADKFFTQLRLLLKDSSFQGLKKIIGLILDLRHPNIKHKLPKDIGQGNKQHGSQEYIHGYDCIDSVHEDVVDGCLL
jgi:hypothetical protein